MENQPNAQEKDFVVSNQDDHSGSRMMSEVDDLRRTSRSDDRSTSASIRSISDNVNDDNVSLPGLYLTEGDDEADPSESLDGATDGDEDGTTGGKNDSKKLQEKITTHVNNLALRKNSDKRAGALNALQQIGEPAVPSLIGALSSRDWPTRDGAQKALEGIGEAALPGLEKALKSDDAEVRSRAERAKEVITYRMQREDREKVLDAAFKEEPKIDELLNAAHLKVSFFEGNQGVTEDGPVSNTMQLKDIERGPTAPERRAAEDLLKTGAQPTFKGERFENTKKALMEKADKEGDENTARKLMKLGLAIDDGRAMYARSLSASNDPADLKRGRELVTDQLKSNPNKEPSRMLAAAAAELSMDKVDSFQKLYKAAGGDPMTLKIYGDEARKKQAMRR